MVGALTALVLPLVEGQSQGWPLWTWVTLGGAAVLAVFAGFRGVALRRRGIAPLVDIEPMRARPVGAGQLGQFVLFTGMAAYFLVLALYLQDGRGLGALASGAVFTAVAVPYMVGTRSAVRVLGPLRRPGRDRPRGADLRRGARRWCWWRSPRSAWAVRCSG